MVSIDEARQHLFSGFSRDRFVLDGVDLSLTVALLAVMVTPITVYLTAIESGGLYRLTVVYMFFIAGYMTYFSFGRQFPDASIGSFMGVLPDPLDEDRIFLSIVGGISIGAVFGVISFVSSMMGASINPFLSGIDVASSGVGIWTYAFIFVVFIPIVEEAYFGDFQFTSPLVDGGVIPSLIYVTLYFVAFHYVAYGGVLTALAFVGLFRLAVSILSLFTEGVLGNIIAHVIVNGMAVLSLVLFGSSNGEVASVVPGLPVLVIVAVVPVALVLMPQVVKAARQV